MSDFKQLSKYCVEHKQTGHRICKITQGSTESYELWYRVGGTHKQGGRTQDWDEAKRQASKSG